MPRICYFLGISVYMYWGDHVPPHIHAIYNEYGALVSLETGEAFRGKLPKKVAQLVKEWIELHREELYEDWQLAQAEKELRHIEPLE